MRDLLRLVADRKVSADDVRVAEIATQFFSHLSEASALDLEEAGEFVADAARLLVLKSSRLLALPQAEEATIEHAPIREAADRERLEVTAKRLRSLEGWESVTPVAPAYEFQRRHEPREVSVLGRLWAEMKSRQEPPRSIVAVPAFVRLEAALSTLLRKLKTSFSLSFGQVVRGASRNDAVIHFLAVLELARRRQLSARQNDLFADIMLEYVEQPSKAAARAG